MISGGNQVSGMGPPDDGYDQEGYDESQRAEILEVTRMGPDNGDLLTDIAPDLGDDAEDEPADELTMIDGEVGDEDEELTLDEEDMNEDDVQDDFDEDDLDDEDGDGTLDDQDDVALRP